MDYLLSRFNSFSLDTGGLTAGNLLDRTKKDFQYVENSDTLIVCLPGWNQNLWTWGKVKKYSLESNASFLAYEFPSPILSDQFQLTKDCFEVVNQTVRRDIKDLKEQYGFSRCVLVGLSLASSYGSMVYKDNADITEVILIVPGESLARDMWYGCRTRHLRKSYEMQGIDLGQLEQYWHDLASENNMPANGVKISLYFGSKDNVIPYKYSQTIKASLEALNYKPICSVYPMGHYHLIVKFLLDPSHFLGLL